MVVDAETDDEVFRIPNANVYVHQMAMAPNGDIYVASVYPEHGGEARGIEGRRSCAGRRIDSGAAPRRPAASGPVAPANYSWDCPEDRRARWRAASTTGGRSSSPRTPDRGGRSRAARGLPRLGDGESERSEGHRWGDKRRAGSGRRRSPGDPTIRLNPREEQQS